MTWSLELYSATQCSNCMLRDSEGIVTAPIYRIWHVPYGISACTQSCTMSCGKKIIGGSALVMVGHWSTLVLHSRWLVPTVEQFTWRVHLWRGEEERGLQTPFLDLNEDINTFPFHRSISSTILVLTSVPGNTIHRWGLQNWCMPHMSWTPHTCPPDALSTVRGGGRWEGGRRGEGKEEERRREGGKGRIKCRKNGCCVYWLQHS